MMLRYAGISAPAYSLGRFINHHHEIKRTKDFLKKRFEDSNLHNPDQIQQIRRGMEGEKDAAAAKAIVVEEEDGEEAVYSVWAVPPEDVRERLRKLMQNLRAEFSGPEFDPHVTVVGAMRLTKRNAIQKLQSACAGLKPYTVRIVSVSRGNFFYQCVYLLLHPTPEVMEAGAHCCSHFGYKSLAPYMPHLSLLYGDLADEEKEKAVERANSHDQDICNLSFEVSHLALYKTDTEDKTLNSWEKVADCILLNAN